MDDYTVKLCRPVAFEPRTPVPCVLAPSALSLRRRIRRAFVLLAASSLAGCASGPAFERPAAPTVGVYTTSAMPGLTESSRGALGQSQRLVTMPSDTAPWWRALRSPALDSLIALALTESPTVRAAEATLRQSQELFAAQTGATRYPQADATLGAQRQRFNPAALGQNSDAREFNLFNASVGVRYKLDLFGGNRRALEALAARTDYRHYQLDAARLTLSAAIVGTAVTQAQLLAQMEATEAILQIDEEELRIAQERLRLGAAAPDEVLALQQQRDQTRASIPRQRQLVEQTAHRLATLAGRAPGAPGLPSFTMSDLVLPTELPLVVPSELVRRRPDVQAAEALMHAANAEYGVAIAKLYPQINLSSSVGTQALSAGALFGGGTAIWSLVSQLTQPLLNPGLPAEKRAALAAFEASVANYQGVVLESLRDMADILRALDNDAQALTALASADEASQAALESVERQYALGAVGYLQVLAARKQSRQAQINVIAARAQRVYDSVGYYQAVGGTTVVAPQSFTNQAKN